MCLYSKRSVEVKIAHKKYFLEVAYSSRRIRPTCGIEIMLRICFLQVWFNLSDEGSEDAFDFDSFS